MSKQIGISVEKWKLKKQPNRNSTTEKSSIWNEKFTRWFNSSLGTIEENISEREGRSIETIQTEAQSKKKKLKKNEQSLNVMWEIISSSLMYV